MKANIDLTMKNKMWDIFQTKLGYNPLKMTANERGRLEKTFYEIASITEGYVVEELNYDELVDYGYENQVLRDEIMDLKDEIDSLEDEIDSLESKNERLTRATDEVKTTAEDFLENLKRIRK